MRLHPAHRRPRRSRFGDGPCGGRHAASAEAGAQSPSPPTSVCLPHRRQTRRLGSGVSCRRTHECQPSRHFHGLLMLSHATPPAVTDGSRLQRSAVRRTPGARWGGGGGDDGGTAPARQGGPGTGPEARARPGGTGLRVPARRHRRRSRKASSCRPATSTCSSRTAATSTGSLPRSAASPARSRPSGSPRPGSTTPPSSSTRSSSARAPSRRRRTAGRSSASGVARGSTTPRSTSAGTSCRSSASSCGWFPSWFVTGRIGTLRRSGTCGRTVPTSASCSRR
ncbi:hypothetical protein J3R04_000615 [Spirilliplanes yamanashiensis]|nr:hypothetical protein [Spirilliplanes yamanashiensis]